MTNSLKTRITVLNTLAGIFSIIIASIVFFYYQILTFVIIPFAALLVIAAVLAEKNEYKMSAIVGIISGVAIFPLAGFLGVWAGISSLRYAKTYEMEKLTKKGARPELVTWIVQRLDHGYMEDYIKAVLLQYGYKKDAIDAAFKRISITK